MAINIQIEKLVTFAVAKKALPGDFSERVRKAYFLLSSKPMKHQIYHRNMDQSFTAFREFLVVLTHAPIFTVGARIE